MPYESKKWQSHVPRVWGDVGKLSISFQFCYWVCFNLATGSVTLGNRNRLRLWSATHQDRSEGTFSHKKQPCGSRLSIICSNLVPESRCRTKRLLCNLFLCQQTVWRFVLVNVFSVFIKMTLTLNTDLNNQSKTDLFHWKLRNATAGFIGEDVAGTAFTVLLVK